MSPMSSRRDLDGDRWEMSPAERIRGRVALAAACLADAQSRGAYVDVDLLERAHDALGEALAIDRGRHLAAPRTRA